MDGIGRTCLGCQAELGPNARFCPRCGQAAVNAVPAPGGPLPGGHPPDSTEPLYPVPVNPVPGGPGPGKPWPGGPGAGQEPGKGPGSTFAAPPAPAPPTPTPPAPGWGTAATQTAFPARPYQAPLPPATRPQALPGPQRALPGSPGPHQAPAYPPPVSERPVYEQRPPGPQGFDPFRSSPPAAPSHGGPPPQGPPRQPPRRHDGRRSGSFPALWIALLVLLVGGGAAGVLIAHPFGHRALRQTASSGTRPGGPAASTGSGGAAAASPAVSGGVSTSPAASSSAPAVTEQQAAASVAAMLSQSVSDRAAIGSAAADVGDCGPNLSSDPKVFDDAANSRQSLLARLSTMPGRAALPSALIGDLTQAWQASVAADQAYARWANDEITQGCRANDTSDAGYRATVTPNANATKYKAAFVSGWNPIAAQYGLTQYQQDQL
jgi:hypothetical protein